MAHRIKVETVPALNKDGSPSKTKKVHHVWHRGRRGGNRLAAVCKTKKDLDIELKHLRQDYIDMHLEKHPNDMAFRRKHGLA
jgi:hypothetical protein